MTTFRDLEVGDSFEFVDPDPKFIWRCRKTSPHKFHDKHREYRVASVNAKVCYVIRRKKGSVT